MSISVYFDGGHGNSDHRRLLLIKLDLLEDQIVSPSKVPEFRHMNHLNRHSFIHSLSGFDSNSIFWPVAKCPTCDSVLLFCSYLVLIGNQ